MTTLQRTTNERDIYRKVLRQIADRKRRTCEQGLALACLEFWDTMEEERKKQKKSCYACRNMACQCRGCTGERCTIKGKPCLCIPYPCPRYMKGKKK